MYHVEIFENLFEERKPEFVVILAKYKDNYIFVKHKERTSFEIPGGHIEIGETPNMAAKRELQEETGAVQFDMRPVADYAVEKGVSISYGRLYIAEVYTLGDLSFETDEIELSKKLPSVLTYPEIQPKIFEYLCRKPFHLRSMMLLPETYAVCRLAPTRGIPSWVKGSFYNIALTSDELSIIVEEKYVPDQVQREKGWRVLQVVGPLEFSLIGIIARITSALASASISVFVVSTYDTDYILIKDVQLESAQKRLGNEGYHIMAL